MCGKQKRSEIDVLFVLLLAENFLHRLHHHQRINSKQFKSFIILFNFHPPIGSNLFLFRKVIETTNNTETKQF